MSVVQLKNGQESYELLEYYSHILSNHVKNLKLLSSKCHAVSSSKNSPLSARQKETLSQTVTSCLQDVICLFSSPKLHPIIKKVSNTSKCPVVDDRVCLIIFIYFFFSFKSNLKVLRLCIII